MVNEDRMKVVVHLGMIKTGSTWLQKEIFPKLKDYHQMRYFDFDDYPMDKNLIISNEVYSGSIYWFTHFKSDIYRYEVVRRIKNMFPDAFIVLMTREESSWLKSVFNQYVKESGTMKEYEFYDAIYDDWLNIEEYIGFICSLFDYVFVYRFEDFKNDKKTFVEKFCRFIGEPVIDDYLDDKVNKTLKNYQIESLRLINKYFPFSKYVCNLVKFINNAWGVY